MEAINPAAIKGSTGRNALIRKELADHLTSKALSHSADSDRGDELCKPVWRDLRAFRCDLTGQQFHLPEAVYIERKLDRRLCPSLLFSGRSSDWHSGLMR